jgi:SAM-dependent methyltransferase
MGPAYHPFVGVVHDFDWGEEWQRSWDGLQEQCVPDRELRIGALLDVLDAIAGQTPRVLDLACGTGTITRRLLERLPAAGSIGVDIDPVLLRISSVTFAGDDRVRIVHADLRDSAWVAQVPEQVDAVLTATALHWLAEDVVRRVYDDLARLISPGWGVRPCRRDAARPVAARTASVTLNQSAGSRDRGTNATVTVRPFSLPLPPCGQCPRDSVRPCAPVRVVAHACRSNSTP